MADPLARFHPPVGAWFRAALGAPTPAQEKGWAAIANGESALLLAPTGSGKTLAAFLAAIDRLMFSPEPPQRARCRVLYVSPLKALASDVEKNLRAPIAGIAEAAALAGVAHRVPTSFVRSGDTPMAARAAAARRPPDIYITTPESLFLLLTQEARRVLASVDVVILDEIHALVPSKRGAHLAVSLERLEAERPRGAPPLQRIGLSATQRPLDEVARMLGGFERRGVARPVTIVDAGSKKQWELEVVVPEASTVATQAARTDEQRRKRGAAQRAADDARSVWPSIHARLVELVRAHRSTMIFVNSRRLAERLAGAMNEIAGEEIALAHHGSIARETRLAVEDRLKKGELPAIVATSSLELGIDVGAVDLVVQIESPPSVASGLQRIGRAGHHVGAVSRGVIFPKHRGDLLAAAAATKAMRAGQVEATHYPRSPLDVLAQQIVAIAAMDELSVDALFDLVTRAAPFAELARASFEGVLDMLSGRYPSDEFAELRPRITYDRVNGRVRGRDGAKRLAVVSGGTIPDRGLYGVYLAGDEGAKSRRVGELDEEMVFESRVGDVFLLGASSWRIEDITHDRVLVTPAPGAPGKMPFWHGDRPGRPAEFGAAIGALARAIGRSTDAEAERMLTRDHDLDRPAARSLIAYVRAQVEATGEPPSDEAIVVERYRDEMGDFRVCVLSPFGARVHAPWCTAALARMKRDAPLAEVEGLWSDDGIVFRFPETDEAPDVSRVVPPAAEVQELLVDALAATSLFAARFRENAGRALLLPRRRPGQRSPLWAQRKRAHDLLAVASRYPAFPIVLETYRECLRDVFDLPALAELLGRVERREIRLVQVDSRRPSPFASTLLFSYVASFIYDGDAPVAERRAHALSIDSGELARLLGEGELRDLLDPAAIEAHERRAQRLDEERHARGVDGVHDLLLVVGDLTRAEIEARATPAAQVEAWLHALVREGRAWSFEVAGELRLAAIEDAGKIAGALGVVPPKDAPAALLASPPNALDEIVARYARTHGPFEVDDAAARFGVGAARVKDALARLAAAGRARAGAFTPRGSDGAWCDAEVLRALKQTSLARARREVAPAPQAALARLVLAWQGVAGHRALLDPDAVTAEARPRVDAVAAVIEQLAGAPIVASTLEADVLPARVARYRGADLDALTAAGEVVWIGLDALGANDGRVALFAAEQVARLAPPPRADVGELATRLRDRLAEHGALFFADLTSLSGAFPPDVLGALWELVWAGEVTNDTLAPLRSYLAGAPKQTGRDRRTARGLRGAAEAGSALGLARAATAAGGRRAGPPGSEGRWSLVRRPRAAAPSETERRAALTRALLDRHGVVTREAVQAEGIEGGFSAVYEVLKAMEEAGRVRRGYFVEGLGATQFALPGADDRLRALREAPREPGVVVLAATDPANPYGAALAWPERVGAGD
ncbi:MAG TPA: crosslink repair DNA glycosylase YcaQ family protein, partial [Byssovorax sp.]